MVWSVGANDVVVWFPGRMTPTNTKNPAVHLEHVEDSIRSTVYFWELSSI